MRTSSDCANKLLLLRHLSVFGGLCLIKTLTPSIGLTDLHGPAILSDILHAITIIDMIQQLTISIAVLAARALKLEDIHKVLQLDVNLDGSVNLMAHRTLYLTVTAAAGAEEDLAVLIRALLWAPYQVVADLAQEMMIKSVQRGRLEVVLRDH